MNLKGIRRWVKNQNYLKDVEEQRKQFGLFYCQKCGDKLYGQERHHFLCNKCWNKQQKEKKIVDIEYIEVV
jgi:Zn finger protein HypA/HybF involved in hydrogenase expression